MGSRKLAITATLNMQDPPLYHKTISQEQDVTNMKYIPNK